MLNLNFETVECTLNTANTYSEKYDFSKCAYILLNAKVMLNISKDQEKMKADDRAVWAMYMGIISIIGDKEYAQTTSDMIKCRMFGAVNKKELEELLKDKETRKVYDKYTTKHQYNKLLNILQDRRMITEIGLNRRTYVSYKIKDVDGLVQAISARIIERDRKRQRDDEKAKAREHFYALLHTAGEPTK